VESKSTSRRLAVGAVADGARPTGSAGEADVSHGQCRRDKFQASRLVGTNKASKASLRSSFHLRGEGRGTRGVTDVCDQRGPAGRHSILEGAGQTFARGAVWTSTTNRRAPSASARRANAIAADSGAWMRGNAVVRAPGACSSRSRKGTSSRRGQLDAARIRRTHQTNHRILARQ